MVIHMIRPDPMEKMGPGPIIDPFIARKRALSTCGQN
jgi:hypothetical protein